LGRIRRAALPDDEEEPHPRIRDAAVAKGAFGSPFFFVDGEPFWGSDRLDQIERWIETGGW
jgi:2-hydroxychromene-2-carboxylate isomerase